MTYLKIIYNLFKNHLAIEVSDIKPPPHSLKDYLLST